MRRLTRKDSPTPIATAHPEVPRTLQGWHAARILRRLQAGGRGRKHGWSGSGHHTNHVHRGRNYAR
eukprot:932454-Prymnesium_polylepis.1